MEEEVKVLKFSEIPTIESLCAIFGLAFPESANDFQKSALTLAHLMASLRDYVLKGHDIPVSLINRVLDLAEMMMDNHEHQR